MGRVLVCVLLGCQMYKQCTVVNRSRRSRHMCEGSVVKKT
jgi:hypothetical protein